MAPKLALKVAKAKVKTENQKHKSGVKSRADANDFSVWAVVRTSFELEIATQNI